jgi:hypothetical protein
MAALVSRGQWVYLLFQNRVWVVVATKEAALAMKGLKTEMRHKLTEIEPLTDKLQEMSQTERIKDI